MKIERLLIVFLFGLLIWGCGEDDIKEEYKELDVKSGREVNEVSIQLPEGYSIEAIAKGLNYPVDIAFGDSGEVYVAEAGDHTYGTEPSKSPQTRIVQIVDGNIRVIYDNAVPIEEIRKAGVGDDLPEGLIPPVTGISWNDGKLYITHRTRISTLDIKSGEFKTIVDKLPSWGFFHGGKVIFDKDDKMVFFQSTQGNSGPIDRHWMKVINIFNKPDAHEIPGEDVTLTGENFAVPVEDTTTPGVDDKKLTGVYVPLGTKTDPGQVIEGEEICNGAFFRADKDGSGIERIAWGFRSNFGYRFSEDGRLITTQNSGNPIPPREIHDDWEPIYEVIEGEWYGWPDFYSSEPVTDERFGTHAMKHKFVLDEKTHKKLLKGKKTPIKPLAKLGPHTSAEGFVFGKKEFGIDPSEILVAEFGTIVPHTKDEMPGFRVSRVNLENGGNEPFIFNKGKIPASVNKSGGIERPIQLEWGPDGSLYLVDFGIINIDKTGMQAENYSGVVWKIKYNGSSLLPLVEPEPEKEKKEQGH